MATARTETGSRIHESASSPEFVVELLDDDWQQRLFNPLLSPDAEPRLLDLRHRWKEAHTTVLTSGGYDLLHIDHAAYLLDTKLQGAPSHYRARYEPETRTSWEDLPDDARYSFMRDFLQREELKLIVSVDGNEKIAQRKGSRPEKGGGIRPLLDWRSRGRIIAALSLGLYGKKRIPIADAITINDPIDLAGTSHENMLDQAALIQPDVWAAYHESEYIFEEVPTDDRLQEIEVRRIDEVNYIGDPLFDGKVGTTGILKRMRGD